MIPQELGYRNRFFTSAPVAFLLSFLKTSSVAVIAKATKRTELGSSRALPTARNARVALQHSCADCSANFARTHEAKNYV